MVMMIARTGRQNQRYANGCRLIAGCIPYKLADHKIGEINVESRLEVLVVKAQKSDKVLLPKGGWETDETVEEAARREAMEEAGVDGVLGNKLGVWTFSSKGNEEGDHVAHVFPLQVRKLQDTWPEHHLRERIWMRAEDVREYFKHQWMREALDELILQLTATCEQKTQKQYPATSRCSINEDFGAIRLHVQVWLHQWVMPICLLIELRTNACRSFQDRLGSLCLMPGKGKTLSLIWSLSAWRSKGKMEQHSWALPLSNQSFVTQCFCLFHKLVEKKKGFLGELSSYSSLFYETNRVLDFEV